MNKAELVELCRKERQECERVLDELVTEWLQALKKRPEEDVYAGVVMANMNIMLNVPGGQKMNAMVLASAMLRLAKQRQVAEVGGGFAE